MCRLYFVPTWGLLIIFFGFLLAAFFRVLNHAFCDGVRKMSNAPLSSYWKKGPQKIQRGVYEMHMSGFTLYPAPLRYAKVTWNSSTNGSLQSHSALFIVTALKYKGMAQEIKVVSYLHADKRRCQRGKGYFCVAFLFLLYKKCDFNWLLRPSQMRIKDSSV